MTSKRRSRSILLTGILVASLGLCLPSSALALDPPHNAPPGPTDCAECHSTHAQVGFFGLNQAFIQDLCFSCHDGVTATEVQTHLNPTKGPWMGRDFDGSGQDIVCIDCHDPHEQQSALGQHFVGFLDGTDNVLRQTPGGQRTILYDSTGLRSSFIKDLPDSGICETCHSVTTTFTFGSDTDTHFGQASSQACTACHAHADGFTPLGGTCPECHMQAQGSRRQITDNPALATFGEFGSAFTSHHVNDGSTNQIVTKWDCVVCHAEGNVLTGEPDDTYHMKDGVQLKNVDTGVAFADWPTLTASQRSQFCLSCHDSNGATGITTRTDPDPDATTNALNPFNDGLTNSHEPDGFEDPTPSTAPHSRGSVVDVNGQFNTSNSSHHAVLGQAYTSNFGTFVDNAIGGVRTDLDWTSTLNCEDCHYGTPTTMLSGHGTANARYMLRDKNGNDTLAVNPDTICYRCHTPSDSVSIYPEHDRGNHIDDSLNLFGIACLNCHGGGGFGGIHGHDNPVTDDDGGGTYNPNVFTWGSGLDLVSNWTSWANRGVSCSAMQNDTRLNDCNQHGSQTYTRNGSSGDRTYRNP